MSWHAVELLHEFLQETAERIYFRLAVTHCSAAVRAQHLESAALLAAPGVLNQ